MALKLRGDTIIDECGKTLLELTEEVGKGGDSLPIDSVFEYEGDVVPDGYEELPSIIDVIYPIGSIYMSVSNIDPGTLFENTTWESLEDVFLLGASTKHPGGETGGKEEVILETENLPSHSHNVAVNKKGQGPNVYSNAPTTQNLYENEGRVVSTYWSQGAHWEKVPVEYTGGDKAHDNMPPYLAVYIWKRIG